MTKHAQHVVPSSEGWSVIRSGASKATRVFPTQDEAIASATQIARDQKTELYIHGKDGRIRERSSFSTKPQPPILPLPRKG